MPALSRLISETTKTLYATNAVTMLAQTDEDEGFF